MDPLPATSGIRRLVGLARGAAPWVVVTALALVLVYKLCVETYHLDTVAPGVLYRTGYRTPRELGTTCRIVGPRTVVALVDEQEREREPFHGEWRFLRDRGVRIFPIPIPVTQAAPTTGDVRVFLAAVEAPQNHPVLVHCAQGLRRTGMLVAAYQMSVLGYTVAQARDAVERYGREDSGESIVDVLAFIEGYDPKARTVGPGR